MKSILVSLICLGLSFQPLFSAGEKQPNILVILADDLGYHDLSCQGAADFATPRLDALAASGVRFTAGYISAPQCGPSRAGLMSGMHQNRFGYLDNSNQKGLPPADVVKILPEQLKELGYVTGIIGKWHIGFDENKKAAAEAEQGGERFFTYPDNHPWERGFDYVLLHNGGMAHYFPYRKDGKKWMVERDREYRLQQKLEGASAPSFLDDLPSDTYLTDYFSDEGARFIERNQDKPWFLFMSYNAPHTPMVAKADKLAKYAHIKDKTRRQLAAMMDSLDEGVGDLLDRLKQTGQERETIVFFLSDNGGPTHRNGSRNDPFSGRKGDMHEGGIRVPFIVSWPGTIEGGRSMDGPVLSLDILPTVLAAAGGTGISAIHDGNNLLPWLKGEADCPNEELFWSWRSKSAVRIGSLKETRNGNAVTAVDGTKVPGHIYADLESNPRELPSAELKDGKARQMLEARLDAWLKSVESDQRKLTPGS